MPLGHSVPGVPLRLLALPLPWLVRQGRRAALVSWCLRVLGHAPATPSPPAPFACTEAWRWRCEVRVAGAVCPSLCNARAPAVESHAARQPSRCRMLAGRRGPAPSPASCCTRQRPEVHPAPPPRAARHPARPFAIPRIVLVGFASNGIVHRSLPGLLTPGPGSSCQGAPRLNTPRRQSRLGFHPDTGHGGPVRVTAGARSHVHQQAPPWPPCPGTARTVLVEGRPGGTVAAGMLACTGMSIHYACRGTAAGTGRQGKMAMLHTAAAQAQQWRQHLPAR